ncbi:LO6 [Rhynchobatus djiddensis adomavirus 1]|uniref:LO6 n=1 Tax=Rhynchobatus djiddensis adomavirus 1 TaxID=2175117 RepID=A0A2S1MK17_9VIRU|nr:LO6 [Rhynchobatus djiddensis adomavirus 1]AWG87397.1 LO6 [Rhynchobatus djiddensis adomavirus 1]
MAPYERQPDATFWRNHGGATLWTADMSRRRRKYARGGANGFRYARRAFDYLKANIVPLLQKYWKPVSQYVAEYAARNGAAFAKTYKTQGISGLSGHIFQSLPVVLGDVLAAYMKQRQDTNKENERGGIFPLLAALPGILASAFTVAKPLLVAAATSAIPAIINASTAKSKRGSGTSINSARGPITTLHDITLAHALSQMSKDTRAKCIADYAGLKGWEKNLETHLRGGAHDPQALTTAQNILCLPNTGKLARGRNSTMGLLEPSEESAFPTCSSITCYKEPSARAPMRCRLTQVRERGGKGGRPGSRIVYCTGSVFK